MNEKKQENWEDFKSTRSSKSKNSGAIGLICLFLTCITIGAGAGAWIGFSRPYDKHSGSSSMQHRRMMNDTEEKAAKRAKWGALFGGVAGIFTAAGAIRKYHTS